MPKNDLPVETRRDFIKQAALITAVTVTPPKVLKAAQNKLDEKVAVYFEQVPLHIEVNGKMHELSVEPRVTLLDLLREQLQLTGTTPDKLI